VNQKFAQIIAHLLLEVPKLIILVLDSVLAVGEPHLQNLQDVFFLLFLTQIFRVFHSSYAQILNFVLDGLLRSEFEEAVVLLVGYLAFFGGIVARTKVT
jgi:hypothetical protein